MDDESPIATLVIAAAGGDARAWQELVDRYSPLLVSVIRRFRLSAAETEDVAQTVWLRLVEHLDSLREPQALPSWIVTIGRRESLRHLSTERRTKPWDPLTRDWPAGGADRGDQAEPDADLVRAERHEALLAGLAELSSRQRELLLLFMEDPPVSYAEICRRTGIPIGSIGPTRARALERLRQTPLVRDHLEAAGRLAGQGGELRDATTMG